VKRLSNEVTLQRSRAENNRQDGLPDSEHHLRSAEGEVGAGCLFFRNLVSLFSLADGRTDPFLPPSFSYCLFFEIEEVETGLPVSCRRSLFGQRFPKGRIHSSTPMKIFTNLFTFFKIRNALGLFLGIGSFLASASAEDRPNIVWLVSEDNSVHYLRLYNETGAAMPNVERLAQQGIVFNHAFSNAAVCSAARSSIISGVYGPRAFSHFHRRAALVPMPDGLRMFPWYLRKAGYHTTNNSKEDYNFIKGDDVWDLSSNKATYRDRKDGQPFFHVQNFGATHEGKLHFSVDEMKSEPTHVDAERVSVFPIHPNTRTFRYTNARYRDLHAKVDSEIGEFLNQLEEEGLMDDTIIFYYGDHGGVLPGSKGYIYERGVHVPMVVYVPEKWKHLAPAEAGTRVDGFVEFVDLAPTVLNLAGIDIPSQIDGTPFLGENVSLDELNQRDTAFSYADRFDEKYDSVRALRKGKFKYMRNYQPFNIDGLQNNYRYLMLAYEEWRDLGEAGRLNANQSQFFKARPAETLFDVESDPFEMKNLAQKPEYKKVLAEMRTELQRKLKALPDLAFFPEPFLLQEAVGNPVAYGRANAERIASLARVADLNLLPFEKAKKRIAKALRSDDEWIRYWGLIVCSSFGEDALEFADSARSLAASDDENLVRVRAAEFLALTKQTDPRPILIDCLKKSELLEEASLILNTIALIHDLDLGYPFEIDRSILPAKWVENPRSNVARRFDYLDSL